MSELGHLIPHSPAQRPRRAILRGHYVRLEPLDPALHGGDLWNAVRQNDELWLYLFEGPFADRIAFDGHLAQKAASDDPLFFAIVDNASRRATGYASFMRIDPAQGVIEVGSILFSPELRRTAGATESMYLMARHVFEQLGYRRYEWKCNTKNEPSRRAAVRLGFTFEGIFRQHMVVKGHNRDTAWYSMLDSEWPARKTAFERWLDPSNFDAQGQQRRALERGTAVEPV